MKKKIIIKIKTVAERAFHENYIQSPLSSKNVEKLHSFFKFLNSKVLIIIVIKPSSPLIRLEIIG